MSQPGNTPPATDVRPCRWCRRIDCATREAHLAKRRESKRVAQKRRREARRAAKLCVDCKKPSKDLGRCPACRVRWHQAPKALVGDGVGGAGVWRDDASGWNRYRGQGKRGAPAASVNDAQDLRYAKDAIEAAIRAQLYAAGLDPAAWTRAQRKSAELEWVAQLGLWHRFIEELLERKGYFD